MQRKMLIQCNFSQLLMCMYTHTRSTDLINLGITKEGGIEEGDPVDYILYITPQQIFKKDNAKDDGKTEK